MNISFYSGKRSSKRLRDREDALGRITKCYPDLTFDVEWVLGGRLSGVQRDELVHTTAASEGMIGEDGRRRKRQAPVHLNASESPEVPKKKKKIAKKAPAKKAVADKAKKPATVKATAKKARGAEKKPKATKVKIAASIPKRKTAEKPKTGKKQKVEEAPAELSTVLDLYERHRREFERILARLEKVDRFGFFLDEAPEEFDERYEDLPENDAVDSSAAPLTSGANGSKPTTTQNAQSSDNTATAAAKPDTPYFPSHPPYNWEMIRRRMKQGRYILDREPQEEEERFRIMRPYYDTLGKKRPRPKFNKKKKKKVEANPRVLHPKGVNWKLFRDDVVAMCDAGIAGRDVPDVSSGRGSITYAVAKIKEVSNDVQNFFE